MTTNLEAEISLHWDSSVRGHTIFLTKANNGLFIIDDFGRQQIDPHHLLNRWIVPLGRRTDFLSLQSGMKFEIPFDQLSVFATNLEPKKNGWMRHSCGASPTRSRSIIRPNMNTSSCSVASATPTIWRFTTRRSSISWWRFLQSPRRQVQCLPSTRYRRQYSRYGPYMEAKPAMTRESVANAWENYFVDN